MKTNQKELPLPSRELQDEWMEKAAIGHHNARPLDLIMEAGKWFYAAGADSELEECCNWLDKYRGRALADDLRFVRRPDTPKVTKLEAISALWQLDSVDLTDDRRKALETLHRFLGDVE